MIDLNDILAQQNKWLTMDLADEAVVINTVNTTMKKCADAITSLCLNLQKIGYPWATTIKVSPEVQENAIQSIEKSIHSTIPPIIGQFWHHVGGVSLVDLENYDHVRFWKDEKVISPRQYCDGLFVEACTPDFSRFISEDYIDWNKYSCPEESERFLVSLSPDGYHKDNISGGSSYGVYPGESWKAVWRNFEWSGEMKPFTARDESLDFLSYIRTTVLECAGFPAFLGNAIFEKIKLRVLDGVGLF